jgi:histidinol dehydrogenase
MLRLFAQDTHFDAALNSALETRQQAVADIAPVVRDIIADIRARGDDALLEYTARFDHMKLENASLLRISTSAIDNAYAACDPKLTEALTFAAMRIRAYHEKQMPKNASFDTDANGMQLGWQYAPIAAVGLYVPGGKASYPSSVLMNAILAQVAGVPRIAMVVPTPKGEIAHAVLAAARIAGIDEIYCIGGAQAVAALAYGTQNIKRVDKIVGPGNAYVAEAKRQVFGTVGIDTIAGPSEVLIVADANNDPEIIAADLLAQAEHDEQAQSILLTDSENFANQVLAKMDILLETLPSAAIARVSIARHGLVIITDNLAISHDIIARIAPEHLQLAIDDAASFAKKTRHAGAIFLGRHCPEALGDYIAGPSHVLPTCQAARFASGLSVFDFLTRTSIMGASGEKMQPLLHAAALIADAEGLPAHALSLRLRTKKAGE